MATPKFNKKRGLWILQAQNNGIKKTFYSSTPGIKKGPQLSPGAKIKGVKYTGWLSKFYKVVKARPASRAAV